MHFLIRSKNTVPQVNVVELKQARGTEPSAGSHSRDTSRVLFDLELVNCRTQSQLCCCFLVTLVSAAVSLVSHGWIEPSGSAFFTLHTK